MPPLKRKKKSIKFLCRGLTGQSCVSTMCPSSLPQRKTLFKIHLYLFVAAWRWGARLVTDMLSSDLVAFRKRFMLQTAMGHAVHRDSETLSTATRFYRKTRLRHIVPVAMEMCWGFWDTGDVDRLHPFLLSLDLPLQCKSALTSAAGLLECAIPRERARTMQWHRNDIFQRVFMLLTMNSSPSRGSKL